MSTYLLAHDLGTSGNKATLFTTDGDLVASRTSAYDTHLFHANWAEQDAGDWWRAVCGSSRDLVAGIDPGDIACVALSGQMMGCLPVDAAGEPLRPCMIYCDQRATAQADQLVERIGHDVSLVRGSADNLKITYPEDLLIAEAVLARQTHHA